jgi:SAM-dependent methyltransferase
MADWAGYVLEDFRFEFAARSRVLDVGCGEGWQLSELAGRQGWSCGIDSSVEALRICRTRDLAVVRGSAERLPFPPGTFDGVICKVVLPYVRERAAIDEIGRVLRPGGMAYFVSHGAGYYLRYLLQPSRFLFRLYGARALMNTWIYAATGRVLPGFLGDTLYQSRRRLRKRYRAAGLELERVFPSPSYLGFPVFLYDRVRKAGAAPGALGERA